MCHIFIAIYTYISELQWELENVHFGVQQAHQKTFGTHDIIDVVGCVWMVKSTKLHTWLVHPLFCVWYHADVISMRHQPELMERFFWQVKFGTISMVSGYLFKWFTALSQDRGLQRSGGHEIGPPVPKMCLSYILKASTRHDINDVKFQSVQNCWCLVQLISKEWTPAVAFGSVTIQ